MKYKFNQSMPLSGPNLYGYEKKEPLNSRTWIKEFMNAECKRILLIRILIFKLCRAATNSTTRLKQCESEIF